MAERYQIDCINKTDRTNPYERITHVGGPNPNNGRWHLAQQEAINGIENGKWEFYVRSGQREVDVIVAKSQYGYKYLKTTADGLQPNNLLSLPECR